MIAVDAVDAVVSYVVDLPEDAQSADPVVVDGTSFSVSGLSVGRHTIVVLVEAGDEYTVLELVWEVVAPATPTPAAPVAPVTPVAVAPAPAAPVAAPVLAPTAVPASVIARGVRAGARGESVAIIQNVVGTATDGRFGPATRAAVVAFQRAHGLVADGIVGPRTWAAIVAVANGTALPAAPSTVTSTVTASSVPAALVARGITRGASGSAVAVIQSIVGADADGRFGPRTKAAVQAWQRAHGLVADGIVGRLTWAAMTAR